MSGNQDIGSVMARLECAYYAVDSDGGCRQVYANYAHLARVDYDAIKEAIRNHSLKIASLREDCETLKQNWLDEIAKQGALHRRIADLEFGAQKSRPEGGSVGLTNRDRLRMELSRLQSGIDKVQEIYDDWALLEP